MSLSSCRSSMLLVLSNGLPLELMTYPSFPATMSFWPLIPAMRPVFTPRSGVGPHCGLCCHPLEHALDTKCLLRWSCRGCFLPELACLSTPGATLFTNSNLCTRPSHHEGPWERQGLKGGVRSPPLSRDYAQIAGSPHLNGRGVRRRKSNTQSRRKGQLLPHHP